MVPLAGLEPARCFHHLILSQARLPIPPQGHGARIIAAGAARATQKSRLLGGGTVTPRRLRHSRRRARGGGGALGPRPHSKEPPTSKGSTALGKPLPGLAPR